MTAHSLLTGSLFLATSAVAGTNTTPTSIAAPGVGLTIRLLSVSLTGWWTNPAGAELFAAVTAVLLAPLMVQQGANRFATYPWPDPGYALGDNVACVLTVNSSAVSISGVWSAVYYLAAV